MNLRNVLIILLILVVIAHFGGLPFVWGGPIGLLVVILLILALVGVL